MDITVTKDCYLKLFTIAMDEAQKHKEAAAVLYGTEDSIQTCKKYHSDKSNAGVVEWNSQEDFVNILNEVSLRGIFHSHLFPSCSPSSTDMAVMRGLTHWAKMMEKPTLFFVIGGFWGKDFKLIVWDMDKHFKVQAHNIIWV